MGAATQTDRRADRHTKAYSALSWPSIILTSLVGRRRLFKWSALGRETIIIIFRLGLMVLPDSGRYHEEASSVLSARGLLLSMPDLVTMPQYYFGRKK